MHAIAFTLALVISTNALVTRDTPCCFGLTTDGGQRVGSLTDGQQRIGQSGLPDSKLCISAGGFTDDSGRGCILTPPTTQFQCDAGAQPTPGFSVDNNGKVTYSGGSTFYACPTGDNGGYNIYTTAPVNQQGCKQVSLNADNCEAPAPTPAPSPSAVPAPPKSSGCPADINGSYQFPHLIVPIDSSAPNSAKGTGYNGVVSSTVSCIFNFDVPQDYAGKQCSLIFLLPDQSKLTTSSYKLSGNGGIVFSHLSSIANQGTTFASAPAVQEDYGVTQVSSGGAFSIATFECPAGKSVSYEAKASGNTSLEYFQDYNDGGIGLYLASC